MSTVTKLGDAQDSMVEIDLDAEDKIEVDVEDDTPEADRGKPVASGDDDADDEREMHAEELQSYSKRVQKEIQKRTAKIHAERRGREQAERLANETLTVAQRLREENERLKALYKAGEKAYVDTSKESVSAQLAQVEKEYEAAFEAGDAKKTVELQKKIAELTVRKREVEGFRPVEFEAPPALPKVQPAKQGPDERALTWKQKNDWFGKDEEMSAVALTKHKQIVQSGIDPRVDPDSYYRELDAHMRKRFPDKFESDAPATRSQGAAVAPVNRTSVDKKPRRVKLTATQVQLAKRLGVPLEEYAAQFLKENGQ